MSDKHCDRIQGVTQHEGVHQSHVELFKSSSLLQQVLNRLLHVCVRHQFLLSELGKIDDPTEIPPEPVRVWLIQVLLQIALQQT